VRRTPWLTGLVAAVTLLGLVVQETVPGTLAALQRSPAALHGEPWRWVTSLVVQDGWLAGGAINVAGLLLVGIAAEQVVRRSAWITVYVGAGLVGQAFGHAWQPIGAGNSVAVCGLAALLVVTVARRRAEPMPLQAFAATLWCGALASAVWWPLVIVGSVLAVLVNGPARSQRWTPYAVVAFCVGCAVVLLLAEDLHGGALGVALLVAAAPPVTNWFVLDPNTRPAA
jgi:rhomboid protease GluP